MGLKLGMGMTDSIRLYPGRQKNVQFTWRTGESPSSPPIDLSAATVTVLKHTLAVAPVISILDAPNGLCEIEFPSGSAVGKGMTGRKEVVIALTFTIDPGYSPDPVVVGVSIG